MKIFLLILLFPFPLPGQVTAAAVVFASPDEMKSYKSKEEDSYYENYRRQGFKPEQRSMAFWLQDIQFYEIDHFNCDGTLFFVRHETIE